MNIEINLQIYVSRKTDYVLILKMIKYQKKNLVMNIYNNKKKKTNKNTIHELNDVCI